MLKEITFYFIFDSTAETALLKKSHTNLVIVVSGQLKRWSDTLKRFIGSKFTSYGMISKINKT